MAVALSAGKRDWAVAPTCCGGGASGLGRAGMAAHHRVIELDNAGVGETTPVTPLTITGTGKALPVPSAAALLSPNPMTLLGGDDDRLDPRGDVWMLASTIPGCRACDLPRCRPRVPLPGRGRVRARLLACLNATYHRAGRQTLSVRSG